MTSKNTPCKIAPEGIDRNQQKLDRRLRRRLLDSYQLMNCCLAQKDGATLRQMHLETECHPATGQRRKVDALLPPTQRRTDRDGMNYTPRFFGPQLHKDLPILGGEFGIPACHGARQLEKRITMQIEFGRHKGTGHHGYGDPCLIGEEALVGHQTFPVNLEHPPSHQIDRFLNHRLAAAGNHGKHSEDQHAQSWQIHMLSNPSQVTEGLELLDDLW